MALLKKKSPDVLPPDLQGAEERLQQSDLVNTSAPPKKKSSPALLGGGAVALVVLALGAWRFLGASSVPPVDSSDASAPVTQPVAPGAANAGSPSTAPSPAAARRAVAPGGPKRPSPAAQRVALKPRPGQNAKVAAVKRAAVRNPGRVGERPPSLPAGVPALAPARPGQPPRFVPVQGAPTPVAPPDGLEGTPGRFGGRSDVVISSIAPSAALLKELWNQGAAAKARGDKAAARRAWSRILQLSPGHPGIQQAIDKLG
jgi:hypothetical protein